MPGARDAAVVGVYTTKQERVSTETPLALTMEAVNGALADAGMSIRDVDAWFGQFPGSLSRQLNIPIHHMGSSTGSAAVTEAAALIRAGLIETAAIPIGMARGPADGKVAQWTRPQLEFTEWTGEMTPAWWAIQMRRHMYEFGTTLDQMAYGCATVRNNGHKNPNAIMFRRGPYTPEDILSARMVADPFTLLMCSIVNDGGSCVIVTSAERARDCKKAPVWVLGGSTEQRGSGYSEAPSLDGLQVRDHHIKAFKRAGIAHRDIDIAMLYDHFASGIIMEFETMGFCEIGEGGPFIQGRIGLDDMFPVCPDGGNQSFSHPGAPMNFKIVEAVRQFRGEVPDLCPDWAKGVHTYDRALCRKVKDPKLAVTCAVYGSIALLAKD